MLDGNGRDGTGLEGTALDGNGLRLGAVGRRYGVRGPWVLRDVAFEVPGGSLERARKRRRPRGAPPEGPGGRTGSGFRTSVRGSARSS